MLAFLLSIISYRNAKCNIAEYRSVYVLYWLVNTSTTFFGAKFLHKHIHALATDAVIYVCAYAMHNSCPLLL